MLHDKNTSDADDYKTWIIESLRPEAKSESDSRHRLHERGMRHKLK